MMIFIPFAFDYDVITMLSFRLLTLLSHLYSLHLIKKYARILSVIRLLAFTRSSFKSFSFMIDLGRLSGRVINVPQLFRLPGFDKKFILFYEI